ncbi:glycosyltransferase family 2 protein [Methanothrix sp.]|uniref:glycosyltransferase family 2 protein n=1 Tax=Methanothrix sp. TaxID=90426 RepID=UPI003C715919
MIYAIILNYNNYLDTKECIESIHHSIHPVDCIILVDNGSKDGSIEKLEKEYGLSNKIKIIKNKINLGFSGGVNIGIQQILRATNVEYILLINNDALIDVNCLTELLKVASKSEDIGIVGPRIFYFKDNDRIWQGGGYFSKLKSGIVVPEKNRLSKQCLADKEKEVDFISGCVMLVSKKVFEKVGLFDEDFFFYSEDVDFCLRAKKAGFSLFYVPSAIAWHKISNISKDRTSPFALYHLARSRLIMLRKNFPYWYFLYSILIQFFIYTPYRLWQIFNGSRQIEAFWAWLIGTKDGLFWKRQRVI